MIVMNSKLARPAPLVALIAVLAMPATSRAQSPTETALPYDVAVIKPNSTCANGADGGRAGGTAPRINSPGRLELRCRTLADLIKMAYVQFAGGQRAFTIGDASISGGPSWIYSERFDIEAKAEQPQSQDIMRGPMLQKLLVDRFRLKVHSSTTEIPVYALTVAKGGPRLQTAQDGRCESWTPGQPLPSAAQRQAGVVPCGVFVPTRGKDEAANLYGATLENFCSQISALLDTKVIDRTGIPGKFDIQVDIRPLADQPASDSDSGSPTPQARARGAMEAAIFAAVAKIGLRLEAGKAQREIPVVDHAERPAQN